MAEMHIIRTLLAKLKSYLLERYTFTSVIAHNTTSTATSYT